METIRLNNENVCPVVGIGTFRLCHLWEGFSFLYSTIPPERVNMRLWWNW